MQSLLDPQPAARILREGGIIAYPTEGVWGLGCDPFNRTAVKRLLRIKQRSWKKGLIVIAANAEQIIPQVNWAALKPGMQNRILASWPGPNTWILPCESGLPHWVRGEHGSIAVRVPDHPAALALARAFDGLVVSTSANRAGQPPARQRNELDPELLDRLDGCMAGETGGRKQASCIRDALSGEILRGA